MTEIDGIKAELTTRFKTRSMGIKLIVVCGLALLMSIPSAFVNSLVSDRTQRAGEVTKEISNYVGGQQTFLGPVLVIPYSIPPKTSAESGEHGNYIVFPEQGSVSGKTKIEVRHRSLFKVPVFKADLDFNSTFNLNGVPNAAPANAQLDWPSAEIIVGVSDPRGALSDGTITIKGQTRILVPSITSDGMTLGSDSYQPLHLTLFGVKAGDLIQANTISKVEAKLSFSGAQRLALLAYSKSTTAHVGGNWPNPSFDGGFLPVSHSVSADKFTADWSVPFLARGVRDQGRANTLNGLSATALGVTFIEVADPYQSVNRALKYSPLFIGLLFLSYFMFEATTGKRVHPAQYILVGITQTIFYLLLLSFAERIGFDFGFLLGGTATVALLSFNASWIFQDKTQGLRALAIFSLLYSLIYLLLRLEDNALLIGAIASFLAVAATMYFTRKIDWYSTLTEKKETQ